MVSVFASASFTRWGNANIVALKEAFVSDTRKVEYFHKINDNYWIFGIEKVRFYLQLDIRNQLGRVT